MKKATYIITITFFLAFFACATKSSNIQQIATLDDSTYFKVEFNSSSNKQGTFDILYNVRSGFWKITNHGNNTFKVYMKKVHDNAQVSNRSLKSGNSIILDLSPDELNYVMIETMDGKTAEGIVKKL